MSIAAQQHTFLHNQYMSDISIQYSLLYYPSVTENGGSTLLKEAEQTSTTRCSPPPRNQFRYCLQAAAAPFPVIAPVHSELCSAGLRTSERAGSKVCQYAG